MHRNNLKQHLAWLLAFAIWPASAEIVGEQVSYQGGGKTMQGFIAYDDAIQGKRPAVLVVHEWWGHNDYARKRARMLAEQGYTAMAVDMYGDGATAEHPKDAGKFASEVRGNMDTGEQRFDAALSLLQAHPTVNGEQISAIGYCFGGGVVLEMARRGKDLDLVASFHGSPVANQPAQPGKTRARVLLFNGADDPMVTPEQIDEFKQEMEAAGIDYQVVNYPGAKHSFTNPDADGYAERFALPVGYNAEADKDSWEQLGKALHNAYAK